MEDYARLKQRLILATLIVSAAAVVVTAVVFDLPTAGSLLVGALAGVLYLCLRAAIVWREPGPSQADGWGGLVRRGR
jgi:ATP synthase protein I